MRSGARAGRKGQLRILKDVRDDLAVEISNEMKRRGLRLCDLQRFGYGTRQIEDVSRYLRGLDCWFGHEAALTLAEKLGIKTAFVSGAEVEEFERFLAFRRKTAARQQVAA